MPRELRSGARRHPGLKDLRPLWRILGTGEEVAKQFQDLQKRVPVPLRMVARSYFPSLQFEAQLEFMERLATQVMPAL